MNWGGASRAERVSRFGGDRVESDQMGRNKPPKPKKRPKPPKRKDGSICTPHSWSDWYGPQFGNEQYRRCAECNTVQKRVR